MSRILLGITHGIPALGLLVGLAPTASAQLQWRLVSLDTSTREGLSPPIEKAIPHESQLPSTGIQSVLEPEDSTVSGFVASTPQQVLVASASAPDLTAQSVEPSSTASPIAIESTQQLRESLRIPPIVKFERPWPSPSLSPGVPSAFVANWGDVFAGISGATAGKQRPDVDGSFNVGFGLGDSAKLLALELSGGCGSFKQFCGNGSFTARVGRLLVNQPASRLSIAAAWQNFAQWGNEGRQDNIYYGAVSYSIPLRPPGSGFGQTLQINAGVGNSSYAPFTETNSESSIGGFGSIGIELSPALGLSAGWSGRGANAQLSYTPFRDTPITLNVLGSDLFNQTPAGAVAVFSLSWGRNFATPSFN